MVSAASHSGVAQRMGLELRGSLGLHHLQLRQEGQQGVSADAGWFFAGRVLSDETPRRKTAASPTSRPVLLRTL